VSVDEGVLFASQHSNRYGEYEIFLKGFEITRQCWGRLNRCGMLRRVKY